MLPAPDSEDLTRLLLRVGEDVQALDELVPLVLAELRRLAYRQLERERRSHTLQPTALVNEAYLRMVGQDAGYASRQQFFRVAAMMMRRVLIDHARERGRRKRELGARRVELTDSLFASPEATVDIEVLDEALERLEQLDPRKVRIVELRYFAGKTIAETAEVLDISPATVSRDWDVARLWLLREIRGDTSA